MYATSAGDALKVSVRSDRNANTQSIEIILINWIFLTILLVCNTFFCVIIFTKFCFALNIKQHFIQKVRSIRFSAQDLQNLHPRAAENQWSGSPLFKSICHFEQYWRRLQPSRQAIFVYEVFLSIFFLVSKDGKNLLY